VLYLWKQHLGQNGILEIVAINFDITFQKWTAVELTVDAVTGKNGKLE